MLQITGQIQYGGTHSDFCRSLEQLDTPLNGPETYRQFIHLLLDEWLDKQPEQPDNHERNKFEVWLSQHTH